MYADKNTVAVVIREIHLLLGLGMGLTVVMQNLTQVLTRVARLAHAPYFCAVS